MVPPKGRWPPSSKCGGTEPGVVEMSLDSARSMIFAMSLWLREALFVIWKRAQQELSVAASPS
jgi:hypothetical protein